MFNKSMLMLIVSAFIFCSSDALADSIWGKLKGRIKNEVENVVTGKVARKAGDKAGEATDAVLNPVDNREQDKQAGQQNDDGQGQYVKEQNQSAKATKPSKNIKVPGGLSGFGGMLNAFQKKVDVDDKYTFILSIDATQTSNGQSSNMGQWFSDSAFMLKSEDETATQVIMDFKNKAMIMLDEKAKTKTVMSTDLIKSMAKMGGARAQQSNAQQVAVQSIKRTGKRKNILGYSAEQWVSESSTEQTEIWVAKDLDFDYIGFTKKMMDTFTDQQSQSMFDFSLLQKGDYPIGVILESMIKSGSEVKSHYLVTNVSRKPMPIAVSTYRTKSIMEGI